MCEFCLFFYMWILILEAGLSMLFSYSILSFWASFAAPSIPAILLCFLLVLCLHSLYYLPHFLHGFRAWLCHPVSSLKVFPLLGRLDVNIDIDTCTHRHRPRHRHVYDWFPIIFHWEVSLYGHVDHARFSPCDVLKKRKFVFSFGSIYFDHSGGQT